MAVAESWTKKYFAEIMGTFVLVFLGDSFNAWAVAGPTGSGSFNPGLLGAGFFWGFAVTLAIYVAGSVSGAHLNPAVTLALAWRRGFPWSKVPGYVVSQVAGAFAAAAAVSFVWNGIIVAHEQAAKPIIDRAGSNGVETGLIFSANWPHPLLVGHTGNALTMDPWWRGAGTEIIITALLVMCILGIVEDRVPSAANLAPIAIGFVVAALVGLFAPIEMASLNPARDFGPRLWELLIGYGSNAIPGPNFNVWITTLMPLVGAPLGAFAYDTIIHQHLPAPVGPDTAVERAVPERARA
ncbi:MAG: aquaporin family protein [Chloroflexi bacterium]|nr:MAG: aquaporin family protein [Chloroflexota bacterium]